MRLRQAIAALAIATTFPSLVQCGASDEQSTSSTSTSTSTSSSSDTSSTSTGQGGTGSQGGTSTDGATSGAGGSDMENVGGCMTIEVMCKDVPGAAAARANREECSMIRSSETCDVAGLSSMTDAPAALEMALQSYPKNNLERAVACCLIRHEKTHLDDGPKIHSCQTEQNPHDAQKACLTAATQQGCGDSGGWDEVDCGLVDDDLALIDRGKSFNVCVCNKLNADMTLTKAECQSCFEECIASLGNMPAKFEQESCKTQNCEYCSKYITDGSGPSDGCQ